MTHTTRVTVLRQIAIRYHELVDPMQSRSKLGDGAHLPLMPDTYTPTVREFERLLEVMRYRSPIVDVAGEKVSARKLRWHLMCWYVECHRITRHMPLNLKRGKTGRRGIALMRDEDGNPILTRPITREFRCQGARQDLADRGLEWIADNWSAPFEPMLPDAVRRTPQELVA